MTPAASSVAGAGSITPKPTSRGTATPAGSMSTSSAVCCAGWLSALRHCAHRRSRCQRPPRRRPRRCWADPSRVPRLRQSHLRRHRRCRAGRAVLRRRMVLCRSLFRARWCGGAVGGAALAGEVGAGEALDVGEGGDAASAVGAGSSAQSRSSMSVEMRWARWRPCSAGRQPSRVTCPCVSGRMWMFWLRSAKSWRAPVAASWPRAMTSSVS